MRHMLTSSCQSANKKAQQLAWLFATRRYATSLDHSSHNWTLIDDSQKAGPVDLFQLQTIAPAFDSLIYHMISIAKIAAKKDKLCIIYDNFDDSNWFCYCCHCPWPRLFVFWPWRQKQTGTRSWLLNPCEGSSIVKTKEQISR